MRREDKDLLLKDLCSRLPYGVICKSVNFRDPTKLVSIDLDGPSHDVYFCTNDGGSMWNNYDDIKPYLFPLSSMTDELWDKEFSACGITEFTRDSFKYGCETLEFNSGNPDLSSMVRFINQLIKNHFDIYGLIPKGLAIDATGKNIY